ncbi:MAG TPA: HemK/PrmC family methyltransferase [Candidatus Paceibacterota bacterium]
MKSDEPEAYIIGWQPFLGLKIYLDSRPLIPRPETEWWTEQMLITLSSRESPDPFSVVRLGLAARSATENGSGDERHIRFLDLCAGSGAIGCAALARLSNAQVYFGEIDLAHEMIILKNIRENKLDESPTFAEASAGKRADVRIGDLFEPFGDIKFDIIAANPPYIPVGRELPVSVADYEPALALYAGVDGLNIIRRIAAGLPKHLSPNGQAWIECDSEYSDAACTLFEVQGLRAEIRTDQYDKPRVLRVVL